MAMAPQVIVLRQLVVMLECDGDKHSVHHSLNLVIDVLDVKWTLNAVSR